MKKYKTKQREIIQNFLIENKDKCFSVEDLNKIFGESVGATTIYRNLNLLVEDDIAYKFLNTEKNYVYKYKENENSTNFKCKVCDGIYNFTCDEILKFNNHMKKNHKFKIDFENTLISGICNKCNDEVKDV